MDIVKKLIAVCLLIMLSLSMTCDDNDVAYSFHIKFENKCGEDIELNYISYWDDVLLSAEAFFGGYNQYSIHLGNGDYISPGFSEDDFEYGRKFQLIVYRQSTLNKYGEEELIRHNIYDKLYVMSYEELSACDFSIVYTGR